MIPSTHSDQAPALSPNLVLWVIWLALLLGLFSNRFILGSGLQIKDDWSKVPEAAAILALLLPVALSSILRWLILPRFSQPSARMVPFIFGMALAEAPSFLGIFVFPGFETLFFGVSFFCMLQFIPLGIGSGRIDSFPNRDGLPVKVK